MPARTPEKGWDGRCHRPICGHDHMRVPAERSGVRNPWFRPGTLLTEEQHTFPMLECHEKGCYCPGLRTQEQQEAWENAATAFVLEFGIDLDEGTAYAFTPLGQAVGHLLELYP
jgi:hypothetical protein